MDAVVRKINDTPGVRKILMLSEEKYDPTEQDTDVFKQLLHLKTQHALSKDVEIYVELVNVENFLAVRNLGIASIVLTSKILSLYMLQLLTHRGSARFFKDLLLTNSGAGEEGGEMDIEILPAEQLLDFAQGVPVYSCYSEAVQSFFLASEKKRMLVGAFPEGAGEPVFFCNAMDQPRRVEISPGDKLIVVTYGTPSASSILPDKRESCGASAAF